MCDDPACTGRGGGGIAAVHDNAELRRRVGRHGRGVWVGRGLGVAGQGDAQRAAERVEVEEALRLGLVNHVVDDAELMARAGALAVEMAEGPTFALGMAKKLFTH